MSGMGRSYHLGWTEDRAKIEADSSNGFTSQ